MNRIFYAGVCNVHDSLLFFLSNQGPSHPLKQQTLTYRKTLTSESNDLKARQIKVKAGEAF